MGSPFVVVFVVRLEHVYNIICFVEIVKDIFWPHANNRLSLRIDCQMTNEPSTHRHLDISRSLAYPIRYVLSHLFSFITFTCSCIHHVSSPSRNHSISTSSPVSFLTMPILSGLSVYFRINRSPIFIVSPCVVLKPTTSCALSLLCIVHVGLVLIGQPQYNHPSLYVSTWAFCI